MSCGRICRGGCCSGLRSSSACGRCIGCWKRSKANCEDCVLQGKCCCSLDSCKEQLIGCLCIRKCCGKLRSFTFSKCCQKEDKENEQSGNISCCMEMSWCKKQSADEKEPTLNTASGLSGPALQLHRGGTLLLRRALSTNDSTAGSIKRGKETSTCF